MELPVARPPRTLAESGRESARSIRPWRGARSLRPTGRHVPDSHRSPEHDGVLLPVAAGHPSIRKIACRQRPASRCCRHGPSSVSGGEAAKAATRGPVMPTRARGRSNVRWLRNRSGASDLPRHCRVDRADADGRLCQRHPGWTRADAGRQSRRPRPMPEILPTVTSRTTNTAEPRPTLSPATGGRRSSECIQSASEAEVCSGTGSP